MFSLRRTLAVARKEALHLRRDHRMRPILFVAPVVQLIVLGFAANLDVEHLPVMVVDHDQSQLSRSIGTRLDASAAFTVVGTTADEAVAERAIDAGDVELVVVVPQGTQRAMARREAATVPLWIDGTDTNRALLAQSYAERILARVSQEALGQAPIPLPAHADLRVRVLFNPALQSRWFMLPAIVVMVLSVLVTLLSALAIVKERENGTMEQLSVTPIRPAELIIGKLLPFVVVGTLIAILVATAAVVVFGVPFRGNPLELLVMGWVFLMSLLGFGLLASTLSQTQQQAMLSAMLILLPSFLLGGIIYPISNMPQWAQWIAALSPVRYFAVMVRGVFIKGIGFESLLPETLALGTLGVVVLTAAMLSFRKRSA
ncbi:MAG: ABC-2 type transport system permease protein [Myxococcota bacterium]|jgi:ABC-2 type transport system permease protein